MSSPVLIYQPSGGVSGGPISNPPVYSQADTTALIEGQAYVDVVFGALQVDTDWVLVACEVENTTDFEPLNIWPGIITDKTTAGFRIQLNGMPDSGNYYLSWAVSGVNITPVPATTYAFLGPTSAIFGAGEVYTVKLLPSTTTVGVTITPNDGGDGGVFAPASVTLTDGAPIQTFTYMPASFGAKTLGVTNSGILTDPANIVCTVAPVEYALAGPSSGDVGAASTNFHVSIALESSIPGTVTVTPSDGGAGGTFTPTTVSISDSSRDAYFTYTPASVGAKTISVTNDGGLTDPANLTYTAASAVHLLSTLISYWKLDEADGTGNRVDSHGTNHLVPTGSISGPTALLNKGVYQNGAVGSPWMTCANNATLQVTGDFTFSVWARTDDAGGHVILSRSANDGSAHEFVLMNTPTGISFGAGATADVNTGVALGGFGWHHIICWYDSSDQKCRIRMDGATTYTGITTGALLTPSTYVLGVLALSGGQVTYNGVLDEIGFWKRKLTAGEMTALYNSGTPLPYSSFTA